MLNLSANSVGTFESARQFLQNATSSGLADELLDRAATREFTVADAYVHPNGFWKIRLHGHSLGKTQVRLHYWPTGAGKGDIHDHGWAYASLALRGLGAEDIYREGEGEAATAFSYRPSGTGFALGWEHATTTITLSKTHYIVPGQHSGGEASHIHTFTSAPESDLLTLVVTGEPVVDYSRVFVPGVVERLETLHPTALSREQIAAMIKDARTALASLRD